MDIYKKGRNLLAGIMIAGAATCAPSTAHAQYAADTIRYTNNANKPVYPGRSFLPDKIPAPDINAEFKSTLGSLDKELGWDNVYNDLNFITKLIALYGHIATDYQSLRSFARTYTSVKILDTPTIQITAAMNFMGFEFVKASNYEFWLSLSISLGNEKHQHVPFPSSTRR